MFKMAIDLGYGYTKAIAETGETVMFPSIVGDGFQPRIEDVFGFGNQRKDYYCIYNEKHYFVGDLAIAECWTATRPFDDHRYEHFATAILYATAGALLAKNNMAPIKLAAGLPFETYKSEKVKLADYLRRIVATVEIPGHVRRRSFSFDAVEVFPQAAGAFYSCLIDQYGNTTPLAKELLQNGGFAAVIDCGYKTTDFLMIDLTNLDLIESMSGTIRFAMSDVYTSVQKALQQSIGDTIDILLIEKVISRGKLWYSGSEYDLGSYISSASDMLAHTITDRLSQVWRGNEKTIRMVFLAGGGANLLVKALKLHGLPVQILPNAQFANARGFLGMITRREKQAVVNTKTAG